MKSLKTIIVSTALALAGTVASAHTASDLRIYINPGHGSWTSNDRPMQMIGHPEYSAVNTDTTNFFESNTDLMKGFGVLQKLVEMGFKFDPTLNQTGELWQIGAAKDLKNNLVMSRVKSGPYSANNTSSAANATAYNRNLLEISTEVEQNEFDMFISIHSNASSSASANYHLFLYRGRNGRDNAAVKGSYEMCEAASKYSFDNPHAQWSVASPYINGDVDFLGGGGGSTNSLGYYGYLGVLKHGVPGYLVEGFFHTHTPSAHRAMNWDVDMIEGFQYARGVAEYFSLEKRDTTGEIYGIVRDAHTRFSHALYTPTSGTDDVLRPINGCKVTLWKDGKSVSEYTTDQFYNGAFVFYGLESGKYSLTFQHADYLAGDPVEVEVTAGATSHPKCYLTDVYYNGRPGEELNYINPVPETTEMADSYNMNADFVDRDIAQLAGTTPQRMIWMKGLLYILSKDSTGANRIVVLNGTTGSYLTTVSTAACHGLISDVADMAVTADGYLIACTKAKNQYSDSYIQDGDVRGIVTFYRWNKDDNGVPTGEAIEMCTTQTSCFWYRAYVGDTFCYIGTLAEGTIVVTGETVGTSTIIRNGVLTIVDGKLTATADSRPGELYAKDLGDNFRYMVSPLDRNRILLVDNGTTNGAREYEVAHTTNAVATSESKTDLGVNTTGMGFFKYGAHVMMTMSAPGDASKALHLYDITSGLNKSVEVALTGATFNSQAATVLSTGYPVVTTDADGNVTACDFALMMLRDNKISRFFTGTVSSVVGIAADDSDIPAVYYDLCGRRIDSTVIAPGIYIKVCGSKAQKVIIK